MLRPKNLSYKICRYTDPLMPLVYSDWDRISGVKEDVIDEILGDDVLPTETDKENGSGEQTSVIQSTNGQETKESDAISSSIPTTKAEDEETRQSVIQESSACVEDVAMATSDTVPTITEESVPKVSVSLDAAAPETDTAKSAVVSDERSSKSDENQDKIVTSSTETAKGKL